MFFTSILYKNLASVIPSRFLDRSLQIRRNI